MGFYDSTLDPSTPSPSLPIFQPESIEFPCTCIRAVSSLSIVHFQRYLRRALSYCRILCFNIAVTVITSLLPLLAPPPPRVSRAPPYTANERSPGAKSSALLENHTPVRFPYTPHTVTLDSRPFDNANLPSLALVPERNQKARRGSASDRDGKKREQKSWCNRFSAALAVTHLSQKVCSFILHRVVHLRT